VDVSRPRLGRFLSVPVETASLAATRNQSNKFTASHGGIETLDPRGVEELSVEFMVGNKSPSDVTLAQKVWPRPVCD
jgi:hypothetical protein